MHSRSYCEKQRYVKLGVLPWSMEEICHVPLVFRKLRAMASEHILQKLYMHGKTRSWLKKLRVEKTEG